MKNESKNNGAVEKAVQTWGGQYRTLKSHIELELGEAIPKDHPVLQCCAWGAAQMVNRAAVKHNARRVYEHTTGHKPKAPLVCFGETVYWREKRASDALNKYDSEISEGIRLGISGESNAVMVGTPGGAVRTIDTRRVPQGGRWTNSLVLDMKTSFAEAGNCCQ